VAGNSLALQIEDRGLGMSEMELAEANHRLADPPMFDPAQSARLGLLVVAKLAARQGVTVRLRTSPFGGVTAVVLVPADLVLAEPGEPGTHPLVAPATKEIAASTFVEDRANQTTASIVDGLPRRVRKPIVTGPTDGAESEKTVTVVTDAVTVDLNSQTMQQAMNSEKPAPEQAQRSADQVRSRMAAFQSGSMRGRAHATAGTPGTAEAHANGASVDTTPQLTAEEGSASSGPDDDRPTRD
jgi:hypothetical protein